VLDVLQQDLAAVLASSEVRSRAEQAGFELTPSTAQALRDRITEDNRALCAAGRGRADRPPVTRSRTSRTSPTSPSGTSRPFAVEDRFRLAERSGCQSGTKSPPPRRRVW
jgi:hypothetical protein